MLEPGLLGILQPSLYPDSNDLAVIDHYLDNGVRQFLVRSRGMAPEDYFEQVRVLDVLKRDLDFQYVVHHHLEIFEESQALGLHLTADSLPLAQVRGHFGPQVVLGYSAHSLDEAIQAEEFGADYVILGAIFETPKEHAAHPVLGLSALKALTKRITIPVFAIGGIDAKNLQSVQDAGAYGFCALRAIYGDDNLDHNIAKLKWIWDGGHAH